MYDPIKKKKKKVSVNTTPKPSAVMVQYPAGKGASRNVRADSPEGKLIDKSTKALKLRKKGKRLLQSEKNAIRKSFSATKKRKKK